jgi:phage tail-like protein
MSCGPGEAKYRLLDGFVGWHKDKASGSPLDGLDDADGLRLQDPHQLKVPAAVLTPHLPPPWLARGNGPCTWYLIGTGKPRVLWIRDTCPVAGWKKLADRLVLGTELKEPSALAARRDLLAVADAKRQCVFVWSVPDGRLVARIPVEQPGPLVFAPWGGLLVVSSKRTLQRFSITGEAHGKPVTLVKPIHRLGRGNDGAVYAATSTRPKGPFTMRRIRLVSTHRTGKAAPPCDNPSRLEIRRDHSRRWADALPRTGLIAANKAGYCFAEPDADGALVQRCFKRDGTSLRYDDVVPSQRPSQEKRTATLETTWLDSGIPRCRWHRFRVDAELPADTAVKVSVLAREGTPDNLPTLSGKDEKDWEELPSMDALILKQAAGRYLRIRLELQGTRAQTPIVHRVRMDFPRASSMERLPPVYRDNPIAEDFTERFLSLFDASLEDMDQAVEKFARLLSTEHAPHEALPWLATLFGVQLDPSWEEQRLRKVLAALPRLYARRGTIAGLTEAISLLFDIEPAIMEHAVNRPWCAVDSAVLRSVRLFGKAAARFRLGRSALGRSGLVRFGSPELDPFRTVAHRFSVLIPPLSLSSPDAMARLDRLIQRQKPAHTQHTLRMGGDGFRVGSRSAVGIDTLFLAPGRAVLGRRSPAQPGTARLNDRIALYPGLRRRRGLEVGLALLGMSTVLE